MYPPVSYNYLTAENTAKKTSCEVFAQIDGPMLLAR